MACRFDFGPEHQLLRATKRGRGSAAITVSSNGEMSYAVSEQGGFMIKRLLSKICRPPIMRTASLPLVTLRVLERPGLGSFVDPNPWFDVAVFASKGEQVGRVGFGVSPLFECVYVDGLHIESQFRDQGYASSVLLTISRQCAAGGQPLPITAMHEVGTSLGFWGKLRLGYVPGLTVTMDIRTGDHEPLRRRWRAALFAS
jgi:hypothetical protein